MSSFGSKTWFPGLNTLRFLAASLVVLMHVHLNQGRMGLPSLPEWPVLLKGLHAVSFFFTLSGFLITYLLLVEYRKTRTISIKKFYLRRVYRIWPLYFLVIAFGIFFYWMLVPMLGLDFETEYPRGFAVFCYTFFLANLVNSIYHVGGILHVTWSIAVEEQFYLFWAPLVKRYTKKLPRVIIAVTVFSLAVNIANTANLFGLTENWQNFLHSLQFHYMGIGAGFAWLAYYKKDKLLNFPFFKSGVLQLLPLTLIVCFYLYYNKSDLGEMLLPLPMGVLYSWLIINVGLNQHKIFSLENKFTNYLGKVSYGIYMFHMPVVYAMAFVVPKLPFLRELGLFYQLFYYGAVFAITITIAGASYRWIETPLLKLSRPSSTPEIKHVFYSQVRKRA